MPREISDRLKAYKDLQGLLEFWKKLAGTRPMPARLDLDPLGLKPWIGNLLLVEVAGQDRFRYRVYGTKLADALGHDFNGQDVDALPQPHRAEAMEDYWAVVDSRAPCFVERERLLHNSYALTARLGPIGKLSLPFSADGKDVSQILAAIYPRE